MDPRALPQNWPFRLQARSVRSGPHDWWVIDTGPPDAPALLLLHGLGASGHSFRRMSPGLAQRFRVIVPDLPGQGCSRAGARNRLGLPPMAEDLATLCETMNARLAAIIGHSAGGAIALQMALDRPGPAVIGLNAALGTFHGVAGVLFPVLAQGLAALPFVPSLISRFCGTEQQVLRLLTDTGSPLDAEGRAQYLRLAQDQDHVAGALGMTAQWRLDALLSRLPQVQSPVLLLAGEQDRAVPPAVSRAASAKLPNCTLRTLPGGHLMHEEAADGLSAQILDWLQPVIAAPKIS